MLGINIDRRTQKNPQPLRNCWLINMEITALNISKLPLCDVNLQKSSNVVLHTQWVFTNVISPFLSFTMIFSAVTEIKKC